MTTGKEHSGREQIDASSRKWLMEAAKATADEPGGEAGRGATNERISRNREVE